ncbi:sugar-transfer associated ATP-grasp domain-containing protein [Allomuricauda sp. ARW1Y1]|jgi:hypothetical protein|uniref:sugar-transfer associated ATP-grasp domain-containing protein n=1 Tax=Allomuricauda sp. ARW1Y1 TaxID=2663843 RepID=UPI0015C80B97|nr:sugar-transfer associated ATP-grasp domain-containing protein [Muricauda sp. ARW1Y1]NYJ28035.1 hypothetical protein [Muricauda sp. ARW1Y1]
MIFTTLRKIAVYTKIKRLEYGYTKKISKLNADTKPAYLDKKTKNQIKAKYAQYGFKNVSVEWHRFFGQLYNKMCIDFIPESLFYCYIEPALNKTDLFKAWEDKNLIEKFLTPEITPKTYVKNCNGFYYINDNPDSKEAAIKYVSQLDNFVIKPSMGTYGGEGVKKIELSNSKDRFELLDSIFTEYSKDFTVQEVLKQSPKLAELNPTSINTVRIISYLRPSETVILSGIIRIGKSGVFTDNFALGGVVCGIDKTGKLKKYAVDKYGFETTETESGVIFDGFPIPEYNKIVETIKNLHTKLPYFKLVSWDIMVNEKSEVKIIEYNTFGQGINGHQITNGPLFGDYFDEILELSRR